MNKISLRNILTFFISLIYVSAVFVVFILFFPPTETSSLAGNIALVLIIAITFKPFEIFLNRYFDRKFFRGTIYEILKQRVILEKELERRERMKSVGILAAGLAHEIKNPLVAINTFAEYLPTKYKDPEFREKFTRIVQAEVRRVNSILQSLLAYSKSSALDLKIFDIGSVIQEILDLQSEELIRKKIQSEYTGTAPKVLADPDQIKQALLNLIMNATDAMKDGGRLTVASKPSKHGVELTIEDTGCGIPADKIRHIFDPFYSNKDHGTGLGLAITHSIIENNKGKIAVTSVINKGTKFTISLPKANEAAYYSQTLK